MKTINELRRKMEALGGTLEDTDYNLHLDAPSGYVWAANSLPSYTIHYATNRQSWLVLAVREELSNLKMGLTQVNDPVAIATYRHDLDDDNWGAPAGAPNKLEWPK